MKLAHLLFGIIPFAMTLPGGASAAETGPHPVVHIKTNMGEIVVQLDHDKAPVTVDNFIKYVQSGFYDGTIFHRVIKGFMIQGGGYTENFDKKSTRPPIKNEADNGLRNDRGTIAMARTPDPNSATAQFFINLVDNDALNYKSPTMDGWGYAVFGKVIKGMDVVDSIAAEPTGRGGPSLKFNDVPQKTVAIEKVTLEGKDGGK